MVPTLRASQEKNPPHKRVSNKDKEERSVPVIAIDYMYMTNREHGKGNPIVVVKDSEKDGVWAFMALKKGSGNSYIAESIARVINFTGYKQCTIRCDQEPAMRDLQKEIRKEIWKERIQAANEVKELLGSDRIEASEPENIETTLENSPVGESQSNGLVERAIQSVQEQITVIKDTLEHEADMTIGPQHKIWPWLIEYAAHTLLASNMGQDGKTALERYRADENLNLISCVCEYLFTCKH